MTECLVELLPHHSEPTHAQTSPLQQLIVMVCCQRPDAVVAKHRVNDSPALKKADVGIAMGVVTLDAAKNTGHAILLSNIFASIVTGWRKAT